MLCLSPRVFFCSATLRPRRPYGLLGNEAQDVHLDSHAAREGSVLLLPSTTSIFNVRFGCWTRWRSRRMTFSARNDHITWRSPCLEGATAVLPFNRSRCRQAIPDEETRVWEGRTSKPGTVIARDDLQAEKWPLPPPVTHLLVEPVTHLSRSNLSHLSGLEWRDKFTLETKCSCRRGCGDGQQCWERLQTSPSGISLPVFSMAWECRRRRRLSTMTGEDCRLLPQELHWRFQHGLETQKKKVFKDDWYYSRLRPWYTSSFSRVVEVDRSNLRLQHTGCHTIQPKVTGLKQREGRRIQPCRCSRVTTPCDLRPFPRFSPNGGRSLAGGCISSVWNFGI